MTFDTNSPNTGGDLIIATDHTIGSRMRLIPAVKAEAPRSTQGPLLAYLDGLFASTLEAARVQLPSAKLSPVQSAMPNTTSYMAGPTAEDLSARDEFLSASARTPAIFDPPSSPHLNLVAPRKAERGFGPPVYIGFDAEWRYHSKGRNKLLSVQFYIIGPTGKRFGKVYEVECGEAIDRRPSLVEVLDDFLDDAECYCVFDEWPREIVLCGFFTRADLPVFRDAKDFIVQARGINGTLATVGKPASMSLPMSDARALRLKHRYSSVIGGDFDPKLLQIRLIDARNLAPPGVSLFQIGEWLGLPKLNLPEGYTKDRMDKLQRERPDFFRAYGLRDAEIAVLYVLWVLWFCNRHLGLKGMSATASGIGVRLAEQCMMRDGAHPDVALNFTKKLDSFWSERYGHVKTKFSREPIQIRKWLEVFLADAYLGGRNECYWFGPTLYSLIRKLFDHDLCGCYVVTLAGMMALDYDRIKFTKSKAAFRGHVAGYAQVKFSFLASVRFPCLPVTAGSHGLWFPRSGVSIATAPEIELALELGAEIDVLFGVVIPWMNRDEVFARSAELNKRGRKRAGKKQDPWLEPDGDAYAPDMGVQFPPESYGDKGYRPFESFAICTRTMRLKYRRKTLPNEFMKLIGNACYGKTGQGYKNKKSFNPQDYGSVKVGPSTISEAGIAAMVSGLARAVLGEILAKLPEDALVVSATTDGLLVDMEQLDLSGTMCQRFQSLVDRVAPGTGMTELKHVIGQAVAAKTRLQLTGSMVEGEAPVVAKGGIKVLLDSANGDEAKEKELLRPENQNAFVLDLFINRVPGQMIKRPSLMAMRDMLPHDFDLQMVDREVKLSMEFDFKRKPVNPRMVMIESRKVEHLAFDTEPWKTVGEGLFYRTLFDKWREKHCLKTMADWLDWQAFKAHHVGNALRKTRFRALQDGSVEAPGDGTTALKIAADSAKTGAGCRGVSGVRYLTKSGYLGVVKRAFVAAYVQREWGLESVDLSQAKLAAWMTEAGYPITVGTIKSYGRDLLHEHIAPATPEVMDFLAVVKKRFPGFEMERVLVRID